jgi:SAM-dependent methyltransferase
MEMIDRVCPLCGSSDDSQVFAEADFDFSALNGFAFASRKIPEYMHYRMVSCPSCDLLYASPVPNSEELSGCYSAAAFDSSVEARCAALTYAGLLPQIMKRLPDLHGTLDIGTGDGAFLEQLIDHGFTGVSGLEPSKAPIAAARETIRPLIKEGVFNPNDFAEGTMSLVTCFQTLEHLPDPLAMCSRAYDLLKPGGGAFFVCHNRRSFSARLLGTKSPIFDIEHLQLFSPQSGAQLMKRCGFLDIQVKTLINSYPLSYWLKLLPFPAAVKQTILKRIEGTAAGACLVSLPVGNLAVIGYKPR